MNFLTGGACESSAARAHSQDSFWFYKGLALALFIMVGCQSQDQKTTQADQGEPALQAVKPKAAQEIFQEEASRLGLEFIYENGFDGNYYMPEIMGGGAALFDYDNDGDLDIYLIQGGWLTPGAGTNTGDRLFRNDMVAGEPESLSFTDVTQESGIVALGYGQGVATGDYDNDGWMDLYVTNFGPNQFWRNLGNGRFEEVSEKTGIQDPAWSVSASFFDYDRDGHLDLYIGNYCEYQVAINEKCFSPQPDYCNPVIFNPAPDSLWRNLGDGRFENATEKSGMHKGSGRALGVLNVDVDNDGLNDLYVANDLTVNLLWMNNGDGTFTDRGMISGSGVVFNGLPGASMGVDAGDFDNDGDEDLFMTHLTGQLNTLYVNDGLGNFRDRTQGMGLGGPSLPFTGFGTAFLDFDNDGWLDLLTVNGAVRKKDALIAAGEAYPFQEVNQLFRNRQGQGFDYIADAGSAFSEAEISRGAAFGDVDNDGDTDVVIINIRGPLRFLRNRVENDSQWIGFRLLGLGSKRDMLGARVLIDRGKGAPLLRRVNSDGSFASANDARILAGLGPGVSTVRAQVLWPDGQREDWSNLSVNRYWTLVQGEGDQVN